jgi:predicted dehydrogenase
MKDIVKVGVIGLGARGMSLLSSILLQMNDVKVVAVCDKYEDRCEAAAEKVEAAYGERPTWTTDYKRIMEMAEVDAVVISASWTEHVNMAIAAMEAGKYAACEVGGAYSVQECWRLVETYERTNVPCMLMENCCYGRDEMMVMNIVKQGMFGEIVHASGGYHHDLREEIASGIENRHYRLANYLKRNCENYPTHELGPIAQVLGINRGNRLLSLVSMSSKSSGMKDYLRRVKPEASHLIDAEFMQGDVVTTIMKCALGQTITLTLDTTLPRAYSRGFTIRGTRGMYAEDTRSLYLDGQHDHDDPVKLWGNTEQYRDQFEHPLWKTYLEEGIKGGHDGMDWLVFSGFFDAVKKGVQTPIDIYDMAAWMCISTLSEDSIALGGHPVAIPDFTNGNWIQRV